MDLDEITNDENCMSAEDINAFCDSLYTTSVTGFSQKYFGKENPTRRDECDIVHGNKRQTARSRKFKRMYSSN